MRDDDNLIGYNIFFLKEHPHYKDHVFATNDIVYIDPKYREELTSPEFFKWCEDQLKSSGVSVITYHMKVMKSFQSLMKLLEMDHAEHVYTKYIGQ
jgi:spermidine synthase